MSKTFSGWVVFAAVMLFVVGVLNVIWGIAAIGDSSFFVQDQKYIFSNLNTWGWITLVLGIGQLFAGFSLWSGGLYGRAVAILAGTLGAVAALLSIPAYPFWSLAVFALSVIVIHQVAVYGAAGVERDDRSPERVQAARRDLVS
jgi:magnesium-transporting ATPase (P-type)